MYRNIYYKLTGLFTFKFRSSLKKFFLNYVAASNLDKKLEKYLNYENGYFVELGANDGINQSNTFYFEKKKKWKGVLIEPYKKNFIECKKNRSKKNKFFCVACVAKNFKKKYIKLIYANLLTTFSANKNNVKKITKNKLHADKNQKTPYFFAKAKTLNEILNISKSPNIIDLLSLDVEGAELRVLKGINYNKYKFRYMLVECYDYKNIVNFLKKKNYLVAKYFGKSDYLFKYKNTLKS